jgi:hypothetical protein
MKFGQKSHLSSELEHVALVEPLLDESLHGHIHALHLP